jgi:hypothetical protein
MLPQQTLIYPFCTLCCVIQWKSHHRRGDGIKNQDRLTSHKGTMWRELDRPGIRCVMVNRSWINRHLISNGHVFVRFVCFFKLTTFLFHLKYYLNVNIVFLRFVYCFHDFDFAIANFPFLFSYIPLSPAYGMYVSQLFRYARASFACEDFSKRGNLWQIS